MIDLYEINKKHKEVLHIHKQWRTVFGVQNILEGYIKKLEQQKTMVLKNKIPKYDFGGVFCEENDVDNKDFGLYNFKKGYCYKGFIDIVPDITIDFSGGIIND